jgi:peptidoglycan/LPS O-acetylase OafA/YrhL
LLVIYGHCEVLVGQTMSKVVGIDCAALGVFIFFALSGYLVTDSWVRQPRLVPFILKRSLRIFPGLIGAVLFAALILGPIMTVVPLNYYFNHYQFLQYLLNCFLYITFTLPAVFAHNPFAYAVNASLWTLPVEYICYMSVAAMFLVPRRLWPAFMLVCLLISMGSVIARPSFGWRDHVFYQVEIFNLAKYAAFFFVGSLIRFLPSTINKMAGVIALGMLILSSFVLSETTILYAAWFLVPYAVISIGLASTPILRAWGRPGDLSYGLYLYSFPITQVIVSVTANRFNVDALAVAVTVISACFAFASWHLIEKRALRLKGRGERLSGNGASANRGDEASRTFAERVSGENATQNPSPASTAPPLSRANATKALDVFADR